MAVIKIFFQPGANIGTALSQVTAICQTQLRQLPPGTTPPLIIQYSASSVPILRIGLSGQGLSEQKLFDLGANFIRVQLADVEGAAIPWPYGGKPRQVQVDLNTAALQAKGLSPNDVVNAISAQNLILPSGTSKIGQYEYDVETNGSPLTTAELNDLPIKTVGNTVIYIHDVAQVRDGFPPQTNIVRVNGQRAALMTVLKTGNASTLDIISQIKAGVAAYKKGSASPARDPLPGRPVPVCAGGYSGRGSGGDHRRAADGGHDSAFPGKLAKHADYCRFHSAFHFDFPDRPGLARPDDQHHDPGRIRPGGGHSGGRRHGGNRKHQPQHCHEQGDSAGILDGATQIAVPAFVSTLAICIVFVPMFFLTGVARHLFIPLAEAVSFAMLASYLLSRTLVPTMARYLLRGHEHDADAASLEAQAQRHLLARLQLRFEHAFERLRGKYKRAFAVVCGIGPGWRWAYWRRLWPHFCFFPWMGQDFFPKVDSGQFNLHLRAPTGTRIEETARLCDLVENTIRQEIPPEELAQHH